MEKFSARIRMKEEDKAMEEGANQANQAKAETTKGNPMNITSTTSKTLQMREVERQGEGGTIMSEYVVVLVTTRQSVTKRRVS